MFDKMTAAFVAAILAVTAANFAGLIGDEFAVSAYILLPTLGFAFSRRQVCRLRARIG